MSNEDERIAKRGPGRPKTDRAYDDRDNSENREHTDSLRAEDWKAQLRDTNTLLPPPPAISGFHTCWLTTSSQKDPLEARFRRGYTLVVRSELPDFCMDTQKSGTVTEDRISVNEMVLAKIPQDIFERNMKYLHFDLPNERAAAMKDQISSYHDSRGIERGMVGGEPDGFAELARKKRFSLQGVA